MGARPASPQDWKRAILRWGRALGFDAVAVAPGTEPAGSRRLLEWVARGFHAGMGWMARDPEARTDPQRILPGVRSVVVVALNYHHPAPAPPDDQAPRISRYAWGDDYHTVVGERLRLLAALIVRHRPQTRYRIACDTSPVMDKAWAAHGGLGWIGKNTCLIHPRLGSWLFLGELFLDLDVPADPPVPDRCGTCRACLDVCPTGAFAAPSVLDSCRCISYLTIEHRGPFTRSQGEAIGDWLVGCDLCQEVCPWNRRAPVSSEASFRPRPELIGHPAGEWAAMSDERIRRVIRGTAITRVKPADLRRNAEAIVASRRLGSAPDNASDPP